MSESASLDSFVDKWRQRWPEWGLASVFVPAAQRERLSAWLALLQELREPRPAGQDCIPWLGETAMKERILRLCARGKIAINLRNLEHLQTHAGEDEETAWRRLRPKLSYTGRQLDEVFLMEPSAVPATGGTTPPAPQPPAGGNGGSGGDTFGGGTTTPPVTPSGGDNTPGGGTSPNGGDIFGGGTSTTAKSRTPLSNPPTSPLNLIEPPRLSWRPFGLSQAALA